MYKPNYNLFFKINNIRSVYIILFIIIHYFFTVNVSYAIGQNLIIAENMDPVQSNSPAPASDSNFELGEDELPESDITTKIYRSTDTSNENLDEAGIELEPAADEDVISKEDLINMHFRSKRKIIHREKLEEQNSFNKQSDNQLLPWVLFVIILGLLIGLIKVVKLIKI